MGPSCRRRTRSTRKSSSRRTLFKKNSQNSKQNQEIPVVSSPSSTSPSKPSSSNDSLKIDSGSIDCDQSIDMLSTSSSCSTPKAERFRIPEIKTCPPAPKKRRIVTSCSLRRSPIAFFDPPDIELFFYFALRGISA
ncbi:Uncharacterized protein Adt_16437 [Abeliophyllum distichum]|uniref:Uncharacterized protein n=1 Tax=Abeliophyllum distichum TaxID=126358 RepID=A0ABD1TDN7_9LAMI